MQIDTFLLERNQTLFENDVQFNLTESGVHACTLQEILSQEEIQSLTQVSLGYGYTDGRPALRAAIAAWYPGATGRNVAVTHGASEANLLSVLTVLQPQDEVLIVEPNFMQIAGLARALGAAVRTYTLTDENGWQIEPKKLESLLTNRTRMVALVNPNNPTGQVLETKIMEEVVELCRARGVYLLADEIYRGAEIDRPETPSFWGKYDRVIVTSSLSKAFALSGLRLGWIVASEELIGEVMRRQDYTSIGTGIMAQLIAERVLQPDRRDKVLARTRRILSDNVRIIERWIEGGKGAFRMRRPHAGAMGFVGYKAPVSSEEFSRRLRERHSVFVVAGSWFGVENHVRIGIGGNPDELEQALGRTATFLAEGCH
jgi:aspartate/methionine/tyrosine aminotransferase